ncbi:MAG: putative sensor histidine kinase with two and a response regulator receiver domain, partial [Herminiimonas sp.]|nr:putative sensor histidine kinase with two and a response regulator receiver domain [Herminiimonas sp.]
PEVMKQAIEPFFTTKPSGEGTGLGLSMVHGFINQTGGHFHIDSEVGQGTTISLFFPRHLPVGEMHAANRPGSPMLTTDNKRRTILLVEDEETVRTTLAQMLAEFGYNTLVAADGPEGLQHLASGVPIDFLVTDIGLPGNINGRELANAARESHPKLKVLFITGYAEQSVIGREVLPAGMQILVKPFAIDTFAATVQGMLQDAPTETRH